MAFLRNCFAWCTVALTADVLCTVFCLAVGSEWHQLVITLEEMLPQSHVVTLWGLHVTVGVCPGAPMLTTVPALLPSDDFRLLF